MINNSLIKNSISAILILFLFNFIALNGCRKSTPENPQQQTTQEPQKAAEVNQGPAKNPYVSKALDEIISRRTSWNPILGKYYGKAMPDFEATDINGKKIKLSDYRGKDIMVVMWATWCMPCMQEVPHLNALREIMSADKLAILAISNENPTVVQEAKEQKQMSYTVISNQAPLPEPFSNVQGIPTTFYLKPDGTLKLVTEGGTYLGEMKSILQAQ